MKSFPFFPQTEMKDCGPACLKMICDFYGKKHSISFLKNISNLSENGTSLYNLQEAAKRVDFDAFGTRVTFEKLQEIIPLPCIIHWNKTHYVVLPPQSFKGKIRIADPAIGIIDVEKEFFLDCWIADSTDACGYALVLETKEKPAETFSGYKLWKPFSYFIKYLKPYRNRLLLLLLFLLVSGAVTFINPIIAKNIVDKGIQDKNVQFIIFMLFAQLFLFLGNTVIDYFRDWVMLHVNNKFSISILKDFLIKLTRLPIRFFDVKKIGDIQQRFFDNYRIQSFLTSTSVGLLMAVVNFFAFFALLIYYNWQILLVVIFFSSLEIAWILFFLKKRKEVDYARFYNSGTNQDNLHEIMTGMQEIKLNNSEQSKIGKWYKTQSNIIDLNIASLKVDQKQTIGSSLISQLENMLISFIAAYAVIRGSMTFGVMVSISFIAGQLKGSIQQFVFLIRSYQDAAISMERLMEIHNKENEDEEEGHLSKKLEAVAVEDIRLQKVSYKYDGAADFAIKDIDLVIPKGKTIAIVGSSGSGKTTLLKVLLKYYPLSAGNIFVNSDTELKDVSSSWWRSRCGVVMQDGFIFSDSIKENIVVGNESEDEGRLQRALHTANIEEYIESLPLKLNTQIGIKGSGLSGGQKQRILIARAAYKDPEILFFDEATSALDAENERIIAQNIEKTFAGKTRIIIAHRFSTIRNADMIVVMEQGRIIESGSHEELVNYSGKYYELVANQLSFAD